MNATEKHYVLTSFFLFFPFCFIRFKLDDICGLHTCVFVFFLPLENFVFSSVYQRQKYNLVFIKDILIFIKYLKCTS